MKRILFLLTGIALSLSLKAQEIKNVILMIPDGCSTEWLAFGRWMNGGVPLHIDAQIRGLVRTYCSDSPIGDSAPTGSTYATGHRSRDGFVATYPDRSMDRTGKRFATDSNLAFRPMATLMEAARQKGMKTGEVVTCYFTHATPADFLAHTPDRDQYFRICKQMVHQAPDVLLGGGSYFIDSANRLGGFDAQAILNQQGIVYTRDFTQVQEAARQGKDKIWGLFAPYELPYEIDRPANQASLAEMTRQAIEILSQGENGFFLMVEGSKIDWGAHDNDIPATLHDFLAFDRAVGEALDFARRDGKTLVVVVPDHQTGGPSIGNYRSSNIYAEISVEDIFGKITRFDKSVEQACREIITSARTPDLTRMKEGIRESLRQDFGIGTPEPQIVDSLARIFLRKGFGDASVRALAQEINRHSYIGWTTHGHHGGDVFLAIYHPQGRVLQGVVDNEEIAPYICREAGLGNLDSLSARLYQPVERIFPGCKLRIQGEPENKNLDPAYVDIRFEGKKIRLFPNSPYCEINGKRVDLPGLCIYNGKGFYLPILETWMPGKANTL